MYSSNICHTCDFTYIGIRTRGKIRYEVYECKKCGKVKMFKESECDDREHGLGATRY